MAARPSRAERTTAVLDELRAAADASRRPGMARVGINVERALGVSLPSIRKIARRIGTDHRLALGLWRSGVHEARILATFVADPAVMTAAEADTWVRDIDSWDVGDAAADLFWALPGREERIRTWAKRPEGFVRRAAFAMIARRAVSDRDASDAAFLRYLPLIERASLDDRNEVKKGVNWALRQIGKRNRALNAAAANTAARLIELESRSARWVGRDALRELRSEAVTGRLRS